MSSYSGSFVYSRKHLRANLELPADFRILAQHKDRERHALNIKTLSGGGVMFISPFPLNTGTEIEMTVYDLAMQIHFIAKVIWTEKVLDKPASRYKCGLVFTEISDENLVEINRILSSNLTEPGRAA